MSEITMSCSAYAKHSIHAKLNPTARTDEWPIVIYTPLKDASDIRIYLTRELALSLGRELLDACEEYDRKHFDSSPKNCTACGEQSCNGECLDESLLPFEVQP